MGDIIDFRAAKADKPKPTTTSHIFTLDMYINSNGEYEVSMEIDEAFEDGDVLEALVCATSKFAVDQGLHEVDEEGTLDVMFEPET